MARYAWSGLIHLNILIEFTQKMSWSDSSHIIFSLFFGSCKLFSLIYNQSFFSQPRSIEKGENKSQINDSNILTIPLRSTKIKGGNTNVNKTSSHTSVLGNSDSPTTIWSWGERLHTFWKPPSLLLTCLSALLALLHETRQPLSTIIIIPATCRQKQLYILTF